MLVEPENKLSNWNRAIAWYLFAHLVWSCILGPVVHFLLIHQYTRYFLDLVAIGLDLLIPSWLLDLYEAPKKMVGIWIDSVNCYKPCIQVIPFEVFYNVDSPWYLLNIKKLIATRCDVRERHVYFQNLGNVRYIYFEGGECYN